MPAVVTPSDLGQEFEIGSTIPNKITIVAGTDTTAGKLAISKAANYPTSAGNNATAATPAYVAAAINAAIAALPADKYLASVGSYDVPTNKLTLTMSDGSTVVADLTQLVSDAVASVPAATDTTAGIVSLAVAANTPSTSDTEAATPAYINAKLAQAGALPVLLTNAFGATNIARGGNP